jgi:hypothetical protein
MYIIFAIYSYKFTFGGSNDSNCRRKLVGVEMFPIYTSFSQVFYLDGLAKISMLVFEVQSPINFGLSFGKKQDFIEHVSLINDHLIFGKPAKFGKR